MSDAPESQPEQDAGGAGEGKRGKKGKKDKNKAGKGAGGAMSLANHPRAAAQIRRAKGWGGLAGFALAAYLSLSAGVSPDQAGIRAIAAGFAGYLVAWGCSVAVWRHVAVAEIRTVVERRRRAAEAEAAAEANVPAPDGA